MATSILKKRTNQNRSSVDGFMNIVIQDNDGNNHNLGGIAMSENKGNGLHAALLDLQEKHEQANPEAEPLQFNVVSASIKLMKETDYSGISFGGTQEEKQAQ